MKNINKKRDRVIITCSLIILVILLYILPSFYYQEREWDEVQNKMERELKKKYGMPFNVKRRSWGSFEADVAPAQYDVNDPYYYTRAIVNIYPFGIMSGVKEDWEGVQYKLDREKLFLEKAKDIFNENIVIKESSDLRTEEGYESNPKIGREEIERNQISEDEHFRLSLDIFIFQTLNSEKEVTENRKKIYQFIKYLKERDIFEYSDIFIHYIDKRMLAPSFERFSKYIERCPLERQDYGDSYVYIPQERGRIMMSRVLKAEINSMGDKEIKERINAISKEDLDYEEKLLEKCQYSANVVTVESLKRVNYNIYDSRYKEYETKKENNTLDEHVYDDWSKVKLNKNRKYYFEEIEEPSEVAVNYIAANENGKDLMDAIQAVNMVKLRNLMKENVNLNFVNSNGFTPLMRAVDNLNLLMAKALVKTGEIEDLVTPLSIAINKQLEKFVDVLLEAKPDLSKTTLLREAEEKGNQDIVKKLIKAGVNIEIPLQGGVLPIIKAIKEGDVNKVRLLIGAGAEVDFKDEYGHTLLMYAADNGNSAIVSMLIDQGDRVDSRDKEGWTALMHAAEQGNYKAVEVLIDNGAYVNAKSDDGNSVLYYAQNSNSQRTVRVLKRLGANHDGWDNYFTAAKEGKVEIVKDLIAKGICINARDEKKSTALMFAVANGQAEVVELIIEAGADVNAKNNDGFTALIIAVYFNQKDISKVLIKAGADVSVGDNNKVDALMRAAIQGNIEIAKILIAEGADVNAQAYIKRNNNVVYKDTPLMFAVSGGSVEMVKLLIAEGAEVDYETSLLSVLDIAKEQGNTEVIEILKEEMGFQEDSEVGY